VLKVLLTITKYIPQASSHFRERSTFGFSITQVLLDIAGGIFSLAQLLLDSSGSGDGWSSVAMAMADNPGKLGLASVSLAFDGLFVLQHYVLYGPVCLPRQQSDINGDDEERRTLLG
jgi:cystinosin